MGIYTYFVFDYVKIINIHTPFKVTTQFYKHEEIDCTYDILNNKKDYYNTCEKYNIPLDIEDNIGYYINNKTKELDKDTIYIISKMYKLLFPKINLYLSN